MSSPDPASPDPNPLSPEALAVMGVPGGPSFSIGLLILGFIAIAGALVYRNARSEPATETATAAYAGDPLAVPRDAEVLSANASGGVVNVTYRLGDAVYLRVFEGDTGRLTDQYEISFE